MVYAMAIMSVSDARKYLKHTKLTDEQLAKLVEIMEELAWTLLTK